MWCRRCAILHVSLHPIFPGGPRRCGCSPAASVGTLTPSLLADAQDLIASFPPRLLAAARACENHIHLVSSTYTDVSSNWTLSAVYGHDGKPMWLSFTLIDGPAAGAEPRLRSGEPVVEAVRAARELGAEAVLFNCSQPEVMGEAVSIATDIAAGALQIGVYANAFPPQRPDADANEDLLAIRADLTPTGYLGWARDWVGRGASIVGGCCGIGPEHIAELRIAL